MRRFSLILVVLLLAACGSSSPKPSVHFDTKQTPKQVSHTFSAIQCVSVDCGPYAMTATWSPITLAGQTGFLIFQDGVQVADVASGPYVFHGIDCGVSFTFGVEAHDGSGNHSPMATAVYNSPSCGGTFPLSVAATGRTLQTAGGQAFPIIGDSPQSTLGNLSVANAEAYLDDRASKGFNAVWFNLLCDDYTYCNTNGTTYDSVKPFSTGTGPPSYDMSTPNSTYFSRAHTVIAYAQTKGIVVFLDPAETGVNNQNGGTDCTSTTNDRWMTTMVNNGDGTVSTTDKDYGYGQYLGNTFKDLNNIIWMAGNDFQCLNSTSANNNAKSVSNGIRNTNSAALQTMEPDFCSSFGFNCEGSSSITAATGSASGWSSQVDLNAAYTYAAAYGEVSVAYGESSTKPAFLVESNYEGESLGSTDGCTTVRNCRLQEWWTMTVGGAGFLYGCQCTTHLTNANYPNSMDTTGVTQVGYVASLLSGISWQKLAPNSSLITSGAGTCATTGSYTAITCTKAALASDGHTALIYMPTSRGITVNMALMSGSSVTARWYDPTTGSFSSVSGSPFSLASHAISAPGNNNAGDSDWALLLQAS